jgi:hypothetical protein
MTGQDMTRTNHSGFLKGLEAQAQKLIREVKRESGVKKPGDKPLLIVPPDLSLPERQTISGGARLVRPPNDVS